MVVVMGLSVVLRVGNDITDWALSCVRALMGLIHTGCRDKAQPVRQRRVVDESVGDHDACYPSIPDGARIDLPRREGSEMRPQQQQRSQGLNSPTVKMDDRKMKMKGREEGEDEGSR